MIFTKDRLQVKSGTVVFDLEVSPQTSMTYGKPHEAQVLEVVRAPYIFCFSYCDVNGGRPIVVSLTDFPLYKKDPYNDREVVKVLHKMLAVNKCVIAHNIAFDVRVAFARFMFHGLKPIRPFRRLCTLQMARRIASFPSNTLKELALFLKVKRKMETSKHLWQDIHFRQDPNAWKEMKLYNRIDSEVCREIYWILMSWNGKIREDLYPNALCKGCGSNDISWRGPTQTKRPGRRFQCRICWQWGQVFR